SGEARDEATKAAEALSKRLDVRVVGSWSDATKSDLVVLHRETAHSGWAAQLVELGKLAAKALVVVARNPRGLLDSLNDEAMAPMCNTKTIAPDLWQIGRAREHVYFHARRLGLVEHVAPALRPCVARMHGFLGDTT